jgi:DNA-binding NtrC family response regulator
LEKSDRILIVGETEDGTRSLANALAAGYSISAAPNVFEAAGRMKQETFSAILFDLRDAGADLENIIRTLQEHAPLTPIIVTSAMNDTELIVRAIKARFYHPAGGGRKNTARCSSGHRKSKLEK